MIDVIGEIIKGIAIKLDSLFENVEIYTENVPQGLNTPCFFISCINHNTELLLNETKIKETTFDITYMATENTSTPNAELDKVLGVISDGLLSITALDKTFKARNVEIQKFDKELHFIVSYNFIRLADKEKPYMENLKKEVKANG